MTIQNHIHLYAAEFAQSSPAGAQVAYEVNIKVETFISFMRAVNGAPVIQVLSTTLGAVKVFSEYEYELRLDSDIQTAREKYYALAHMMGKPIWFVPHDHNEGNHIPFTQRVVILQIGEFEPLEKGNMDHAKVKIQIKQYSEDGI